MKQEELLQRLNNHEDGFIERKTESYAPADIRKALVAFANSVPEDESAILFIGVKNDGTPDGVSNPDSLQKKITQIAEDDCYPKIKYQMQVINSCGENIVAVIVEASNDRPHFAGPAFVRVGQKSEKASKEVYEDLIASRNSKAGKILRNKGKLVTLNYSYRDPPSGKTIPKTTECRIEGCDAHVVHLKDTASDRYLAFPLEKITINYDTSKYRLFLQADGVHQIT